MNITVYLSAQNGRGTEHRDAVARFGRFIGKSGHRLIYGGSKSGLMGVIADSVLEAGGEVIGVEPIFFIEAEFQHPGITELIVTETMAQRKEKLMELGDVFVIFPGSTGTLEEAADAISRVKMGLGQEKVLIFNYGGFYDPLKHLFSSMVSEDFIKESELEGVLFCDTEEDLERAVLSLGKAE